MFVSAAITDTLSLLTIDVMSEWDIPFVLDSWLKSFQNSPRGLRMDDYWKDQRATCERLLGSTETLVMRPKDWPEGIVGWLCGERRGSTHIVHYAVTKRDYRRLGVCKALLKEQAQSCTRHAFTHLRPPHSVFLERLGYVYDRGLIAQRGKKR